MRAGTTGSGSTCTHAAPQCRRQQHDQSPLLANVAVPPLTKQGVCGRRCSPRSAGAARSSGAAWAASGGQQTHGDVQRQAVQVHGEPQEGRERRTRGASHRRPRPLRRCLSHVRTRGADSSARARHQGEPAPRAGRAAPLAAAVRRRPAAAKGLGAEAAGIVRAGRSQLIIHS